MVNFKASSHQGEHKRALASQVGKEHQHDNSITKGEKSALLARPWSQTDPLRREVVNKHGIALQVAAREKLGLPASTSAKCALVDQQTFDRLNAASAAVGCGDSSAFLCRPGGDFVLRAVAHAAAEADSLLVDEAQRLSLHVCEGEVYEWVPFDAAKAVELADVSIEVQLLDPLTDGQAPLQVDCGSFGLLVSKLLFGSIVADNELFIIPYGGANLVLRVSEVVSVAAAEASEAEDACDVSAAGYMAGATDGAEADSDVRDRADAALNNHCFRGRVIATTHIHILPSTTYKGSASQRAVSEGLRLVGGVVREARLRRNLVSVRTSDGEVFPVSRRLLRPCIALTQAIRSTHAQPSVTVSVDCLTFDRVLCFLEAAALGTAQDYAFDVATLDQMGEAADALGLRLLQECVAQKKGDFASRITWHEWVDVERHNDKGGCYVTMDGMVLDLEAWLPQHPGGATIIPQQGLNRDCTVFFELFHASRESFTYLREFYIGELKPSERSKVPHGDERASDDFMAQLREVSSEFRLRIPSFEESALQAKAHLGA